MTTIVHVALELSVDAHVPPVPGNDPPLNEYGTDNPPPLTDEAANPPVFVSVRVLSVEDPVA